MSVCVRERECVCERERERESVCTCLREPNELAIEGGQAEVRLAVVVDVIHLRVRESARESVREGERE